MNGVKHAFKGCIKGYADKGSNDERMRGRSNKGEEYNKECKVDSKLRIY